MAENEEIDLSKARRWQTVSQAICRREPAEDVAVKVLDCVYNTLRAVKKQVPLNHLIIIAEADPAALAQAARESVDGRDYIKLLAQVAAGQIPRSLRRHLVGTNVLKANESHEFFATLFRRYRKEWLEFLAQGRAREKDWAQLLPPENVPTS